MRIPFWFCIGITLFALTESASHASDWRSAPRPKFPSEALKGGSEGSVRLRIVLAKDGSVTQATITKSSGDHALDEGARRAVLKWKMKPTAIKPADLTNGREEVIEFRQEPIVGAIYPDRTTAFFSTLKNTECLASTAFPSYPLQERALHHTGTVWLRGRIAEDGRTTDVEILRSSGYVALDQSAVTALRLWRAHKKCAGRRFRVPITFSIKGSGASASAWPL
jgi:TonB family protein